MIDQKLTGGLQDNIEEEEIEVKVEESESDEIEVVDDTEENSETEEIPEEAKKLINPKMKNKTQKRITGLIKDKGELSRTVESLQKEIESLKSKESRRSQKEMTSQNELDLKKIRQDMKKASEDGDDEAFVRAQEAMMRQLQSSPQANTTVSDPQQAEEYFKSKNPWFGVEKAKTYAARQINHEVYSDPALSHLSDHQKLDEIARRTNTMPEFQKNPYQSYVSGEAPSTIGRRNSNVITITRSELDHARSVAGTIDPNMPESDIKKLAIKWKKNIMKKEAM
jgi:hypothetical protein